MADDFKKIPKPQLRGLLNSQIRINLPIALTLVGLSGILFERFFCRARKKAYAEFYRDYDAEAEFDRMRNLGLFQSAIADSNEE